MSIHEFFMAKFEVTTASGARFLGMETVYDLELGILGFRWRLMWKRPLSGLRLLI